MSANISQHVTSHPVLMQETTKECLKTKIHQECLGMGFHGHLAHLRGDAMRIRWAGDQWILWIVPPWGRNNGRGQLLTSEIATDAVFHGRSSFWPNRGGGQSWCPRGARGQELFRASSLWSPSIYSPSTTGEWHISTWLPLNSPDSEVCSFL